MDSLLHCDLGWVRLDQGIIPDAVRCFEKAGMLNSTLAKAHFGGGIAYTLMGSFALAVSEWEKMRDLDGDFDLNGRDGADVTQVSKAIKAWEEYAKSENGIVVNYQVAVAYLSLGLVPKAASAFDEVYYSNPNYERVGYYRGLLLIICGRSAEAADVLVRALDSRSRDPLLHYQAGVALVDIGRSAQAAPLLQKAVDYFPRYAKARVKLAQIKIDSCQYDQALSLLQEALRINQSCTSAYFQLGRCYEKQYAMDEAVTAYQKTVELDPNNHEALFQLGVLCKNLGKHELSLGYWQSYIALKPQESDAYYYLGSVLSALGRYPEAVVELEQAVRRNPRHVFADYALGQACDQCGLYDGAVSAYEAALEVNPRDATTRAALGAVHFKHNELVRAIREFEQILQDNPRDARAHYFLGAAWFRVGHYDNAKREYAEASSVAASPVVERLVAGAAALKEGLPEKALEDFQKATSVVPASDGEVGALAAMNLLATGCLEYSAKAAEYHDYAVNVEDSLLTFIAALSELIDMRDYYSSLHSQRTALIAVAIGHELSVFPEMSNALQVGAQLHDIGKLSLPDDSWYADEPDDSEQRFLYVQHAGLGADRLAHIPFPEGVSDIIRSHHERFDGSGFPDGLAGEAICLPAQIVGLADFYDRLVTKEHGCTPHQAMDIIGSFRGTKFAPELVDALDRALDELLLRLATLE